MITFLYRTIAAFIVTLCLCGCAPFWQGMQSRWDVEEHAVNRSVSAKIEAEAAAGSYKSKLYAKPVVQKVRVPAMIRGGVYIPEHMEYVIVKPGEYVLNSPDALEQSDEAPKERYSKQERRASHEDVRASTELQSDPREIAKTYGIPPKILPAMLAKEGADILYIPYNIGVSVSVENMSLINLGKVQQLLTDQTLMTPLIVSNDQPTDIGQFSYTASCRGDVSSVSQSANGKSVSLKVPEGKAFLTHDGYIIRPVCLRRSNA